MPGPIQVLLVDVDDAITAAEVAEHLPAGRRQLQPLTLTEFGAQRIARPGTERGQVDWEGIGQAVVRLVDAARAARVGGEQPEYWIAGRAPLPVFAHLAAELSGWAAPPVVVNRRKDGHWDVVPTRAEGAAAPPFFDTRSDLSAASEGTGRVAVFISTLGAPPQRDLVRAFVRDRGEDLNTIVELRTQQPALLTADNAATAGHELTQFLSQIPGAFPHAHGIVLLVAGPAQLAVLAGRALNANMLSDVLIPNFRIGEYEHAVRLPWHGRTLRPLGETAEDESERRLVLGALTHGMSAAIANVQHEDLPSFVSRSEADGFLRDLHNLTLAEEPEGIAFDLNVLEGRVSIGRGLLEGLRGIGEAELRRIGAALLFHEAWHFDQNIRSTNYREVGRAGLALEEIDYRADAVALATLARMESRASDIPSEHLVAHISAAIRCMQAFDRSEQGDQIFSLAERRLRRYLIWHLQLCRARTITARDHIDLLLEERLIVEIAPLRGYLDSRYDKVVAGGTGSSELFVVVHGRLLRHPARPGFVPAELVNAVRTFDWTLPRAAMEYVLGEHPNELAPWHVRTRAAQE